MAAKQDCRDALTLALERGVAGDPSDGQWRFYNASPLPGLSNDWKKVLLCEQGFRPEYLALEKQGYEKAPFFEGNGAPTQGAIFLLGRSRKWNEHYLAVAWNDLAIGNTLVVAGDKAGGIGSIRKWFGGQVEVSDSFSKHHAVVFWIVKETSSEIPVAEIERSVDGYQVSEGMFSADGPDKASTILAEHFDNRIRGKVADLGAGWGYLAGEVLGSTERIESIGLFEADHSSIKAAEQNLERFDVQKSFHWLDVTTEFPKKPYDWVIMNPPFHSGGRAAEPELGKRFIEVAASTLPSGGRLLMVANKNLPYEKTLEAKFRRFEKLSERDGFKVFEAVK